MFIQSLRENIFHLPLPCTFPMMTIMTDDSPGQILQKGCKKAKCDTWREKFSNVKIIMRD